MQRYKICQQFTTVICPDNSVYILFQICKDTKFVSNSQLIRSIIFFTLHCFRYAKIQNLSAIHNLRQHTPFEILLFQICKDTKFVSNSQHNKRVDPYIYIVSDMQRYKICQQFTTLTAEFLNLNALFQICKDTKFVSNSQPDILRRA